MISNCTIKREGSVQPYITKLGQLSQQRVTLDPQFQYLEQRKQIAKQTEIAESIVLDIEQRRAELLALEQQTLTAENKRRQEQV